MTNRTLTIVAGQLSAAITTLNVVRPPVKQSSGWYDADFRYNGDDWSIHLGPVELIPSNRVEFDDSVPDEEIFLLVLTYPELFER